MSSLHSELQNALPLFDGFPYLTIRVVPALYHIILLPSGVSETCLVDAARWQAKSNRLPVCLVLARDRAVYCEPCGDSVANDSPPLGGAIISGSLTSALDCDDSSDEFIARQNRLAEEVDRTRRAGGFIHGDLTKGGRAATHREKRDLRGALPDGTPRGLSRCDRCGDWKGICLDPSETFADQAMTVHCYCDNHNRCARCGQRLHERRLNANFYDPRDRCIWHVPGFSGLNHRCTALK